MVYKWNKDRKGNVNPVETVTRVYKDLRTLIIYNNVAMTSNLSSE